MPTSETLRNAFLHQLQTFTVDSNGNQRHSVHRSQGMMQSAGYSDDDFNQVHSMLLLAQPATISATGDLVLDPQQYFTVVDCPTLSNDGRPTEIPEEFDDQPRALRAALGGARQEWFDATPEGAHDPEPAGRSLGLCMLADNPSNAFTNWSKLPQFSNNSPPTEAATITKSYIEPLQLMFCTSGGAYGAQAQHKGIPFAQSVAILAPADTRPAQWPDLDLLMHQMTDNPDPKWAELSDSESPLVSLPEDDATPHSVMWFSTIGLPLPPGHGITIGLKVPLASFQYLATEQASQSSLSTAIATAMGAPETAQDFAWIDNPLTLAWTLAAVSEPTKMASVLVNPFSQQQDELHNAWVDSMLSGVETSVTASKLFSDTFRAIIHTAFLRSWLDNAAPPQRKKYKTFAESALASFVADPSPLGQPPLHRATALFTLFTPSTKVWVTRHSLTFFQYSPLFQANPTIQRFKRHSPRTVQHNANPPELRPDSPVPPAAPMMTDQPSTATTVRSFDRYKTFFGGHGMTPDKAVAERRASEKEQRSPGHSIVKRLELDHEAQSHDVSVLEINETEFAQAREAPRQRDFDQLDQYTGHRHSPRRKGQEIETMIPATEWRTPTITEAMAQAESINQFYPSAVANADKALLATFHEMDIHSATSQWTQALRNQQLQEQGATLNLESKTIALKQKTTEGHLFDPSHFARGTMSPLKHIMLFMGACRPANPSSRTWKLTTRNFQQDGTAVRRIDPELFTFAGRINESGFSAAAGPKASLATVTQFLNDAIEQNKQQAPGPPTNQTKIQ